MHKTKIEAETAVEGRRLNRLQRRLHSASSLSSANRLSASSLNSANRLNASSLSSGSNASSLNSRSNARSLNSGSNASRHNSRSDSRDRTWAGSFRVGKMPDSLASTRVGCRPLEAPI